MTRDRGPAPAAARARALGLIFILHIRLRQRHWPADRLLAPERNLERVDGGRRLARPQIDAAQQQVRLGLVRREIERAAQLGDRLGVVALLEKAAAAIQMKRRQLALLALPVVAISAVDAPNRRASSVGFSRSSPRGIGSPPAGFFAHSA